MNKSKRASVIIFIICALLIGIFGFLYLTGVYPGFRGYTVQVHFSEVSGLKTGSMVYIRGMEKGKVRKIELADDCQMVQVDIELDKNIQLTDDTKFAIRSLSYFGTDRILTVTPGLGNAVSNQTKFYGTNEVIELESFFVRFDKIIAELESIPIIDGLKDLKTELFNKFDTLADGFSVPLTEMTNQIEAMVIKLDSLGDFLKQEGTVKKMMTSEELYNEVRSTNFKLQELLEDIKTNPKKYFTIKIF